MFIGAEVVKSFVSSRFSCTSTPLSFTVMRGQAVKDDYVSLDDERVLAVSAGDEEVALMAAADAQGQRLQTVVASIYAGARLPAQGVDNVCQWCEMRGLCRRDYVPVSGAAIPE